MEIDTRFLVPDGTARPSDTVVESWAGRRLGDIEPSQLIALCQAVGITLEVNHVHDPDPATAVYL